MSRSQVSRSVVCNSRTTDTQADVLQTNPKSGGPVGNVHVQATTPKDTEVWRDVTIPKSPYYHISCLHTPYCAIVLVNVRDNLCRRVVIGRTYQPITP